MQSVTNTEIAIKADETMTFTHNKYINAETNKVVVTIKPILKVKTK